jgi:allantoicase
MPDARVTDDTLVDLAARRLGGIVLEASDEFFAPKEALLDPAPPTFDPTAYTVRGKLMDGWETRRRRDAGSDWCVLRLGAPGVVRRLVVDTRHFRGNAPEAVAVDAALVDDLRDTPADGDWMPLLGRTAVTADHVNELDVGDGTLATHLRLWIHPDGGVARLRVRGTVVPDLRTVAGHDGALDLAALANGGLVTETSGEFFSSRHNLIRVGDARDMGDGWETRRRRDGGHDWVVVRLATVGVVDLIEIDTTHFRGNHPAACEVEARDDTGDGGWWPLLDRQRLGPHLRHRFAVAEPRPATHVRLHIFPDGGVARLRLPGRVTAAGWERAGLRRFNALPQRRAVDLLLACCASTRWARQVAAGRPYADLARLRSANARVWWSLEEADWDEAFSAHPRIGDRTGPAHTRREQAGTADAAAATLQALERGNRAYEERFGRVFLICATGKSADQMLAALETRLDADAAEELRTAAEEQRQITDLRLAAMLSGGEGERHRAGGRGPGDPPRPDTGAVTWRR